MRVLWFSVTPSLYDETKFGGWIASLERIMRNYYNDIQLGIAFEYSNDADKLTKDNVTYYPFQSIVSKLEVLKTKFSNEYAWKLLYQKMIEIIEDFKPDLIQCFGSEWQYGAIAQYVDIPVVIHMQGFLNVYHMSSEMACGKIERLLMRRFSPKYIASSIINGRKNEYTLAFEQSIMKGCNYFMGRTEWDKNIVRYFSPNSIYYYCPEAIREEIYHNSGKWKLPSQKKVRLVTVTQGGVLKGTEIILRTAQILKEQFHVNFEWRITGHIDSLKRFEKKAKVKFKDVDVILLGMISPDEIVEELLKAHMYIHPAIIDNSPNSLCEAQLIGCPVVAANVGGISSLVDDGVTGVLYPYNEPYTLAFQIMTLMENKNILNDLSKNEVKCSVERHDPEEIGETIISIYHDILRKSGNGDIKNG